MTLQRARILALDGSTVSLGERAPVVSSRRVAVARPSRRPLRTSPAPRTPSPRTATPLPRATRLLPTDLW